jgi:beta-lactamase superfamily II metal-dependent hydrolase
MPPLPTLAKIGVEMINVGKGDAILVELRDNQDQGITLIVDGGCAEQAQNVIGFLQSFHSRNRKVVISTHPDNDHIGGLEDIIRAVAVSDLILNDPRDYDPQSTIQSRMRTELNTEQRDRLSSAFERIDAVRQAAAAWNAQHHGLFASANSILTWGPWNVYVVGPTTTHFNEIWYTQGRLADLYTSDDENALDNLVRTGKSIIDDGVDTSGLNNQSVMLLIEGPEQKILLTGDAGMRSIREASAIRNIQSLTLLDVPHHGSRRNVDSAIIEHLKPAVAFISSPGNDKHPRRAVIRKLQKTGTRVFSTCKTGTTSMYHHQNIPRASYSSISPWDPIP